MKKWLNNIKMWIILLILVSSFLGCLSPKPSSVASYPRPNEPQVVQKLKKALYELNEKKKAGQVLSDKEKNEYLLLFTLEPDQTFEVLRWGLKLEKAPCWK